MEIIMANGRMGISSLDRNGLPWSQSFRNCSSLHGFTISVRPMFSVPLNTKKVSCIWSFSLKSSNCRETKALLKGESKDSDNGGFLEEELTFKPTFDDYLKAMESVRTVRERYSIKDASGHYSKNSSRGKYLQSPTVLDGNEENLKLGGSEVHPHRSEDANAMEGDELPERISQGSGSEGLGKGKLGYRKRSNRGFKNHSKSDEVEMADAAKTHASSKAKLDGRVSDTKSKVGRSLDGDKRNLGKISGRWMRNQATSKEHKFGEFGLSQTVTKKGKSDAVKQLSGNVVRRQQEFGLNEGSIKVQKKQLYQNSKSNSENVLNKVLSEEFFSRSKVESKLKHSEPAKVIQGEMRPTRNQLQFNLNGSTFETETLGPGSTVTHRSLGRYQIRAGDTGYKLSRENFKLTDGINSSSHMVENNDLELERAAFKSFEVFTDIKDRPRVLRMEMEERIQKLAKWLNATDINLPEWLFSKIMRSAKIRFSDHSVLRVIQIVGSLGNWRRVLQVIEWLQSRERFKSHKMRYIYTTALNVLGKAKRPVEALNVFHAMQNQLSSYPDLAAYHCIAVTLGQAGHMKELFDVIDCMRSRPEKNFKTGVLEKWDPRLEPDDVVYNAVLNACVRQKQWEGAFWVLQQLKQQGLKPSSTTYGLVMEVWNEFIDKICKVANKPLVVTYTGLIQACLDAGSVQNGAYIFNEMQKFCSPNLATYNILLKAYQESGMFEEAKDLFQKMSENVIHIKTNGDYRGRVIPDNHTFNTMLDACVVKKKWDDLEYVYQQMLHHGYHFNAKHHLGMIMEACGAGKGEFVEMTWKHLVQRDQVPPPAIIKERFCMKLEEGNYAAAITCITSHQTSEVHAFSKKTWLNLFRANAHRFQEDTVVKLMHELSILVAGCEHPHPTLQNLIISCREFVKDHVTDDINTKQNVRTLLPV
ncbi:pentatricopeptide repeat-containing protein At1g30610, chloroplastic-like [Macadamia integrifolia]|uniref:pentatricopeptide repeat-containing protein At1g30610, chloroplastic-like n=1 Tax=Macadamia integrifolia TaxID=60698 RepID=UPI001C531561|nr:pentatricopeptide repeat-containing protein At1g30610, chloroplastic-like [Macadamia integrifolia]